jgi:hypothetical protein
LVGIANYGSFSLRNECCWQRVVVILGLACLGVHACGEGVLTPRMAFGKYLKLEYLFCHYLNSKKPQFSSKVNVVVVVVVNLSGTKASLSWQL